MSCKACSLAHPAAERCEVARRRLAATNHVVNTVVNTVDVPVNTKPEIVNTNRSADRHKPGYMREYMRKRRERS